MHKYGEARTLFETFLQCDRDVKSDPMAGHRAGENALMALCEHLKNTGSELPASERDDIVAKLQSMNLRPYRSYCREHLLDIGVTNV